MFFFGGAFWRWFTTWIILCTVTNEGFGWILYNKWNNPGGYWHPWWQVVPNDNSLSSLKKTLGDSEIWVVRKPWDNKNWGETHCQVSPGGLSYINSTKLSVLYAMIAGRNIPCGWCGMDFSFKCWTSKLALQATFSLFESQTPSMIQKSSPFIIFSRNYFPKVKVKKY